MKACLLLNFEWVNRKLRVVNIAVGTVPSRYNPEAPLFVIDFVDGNGVANRGYTSPKLWLELWLMLSIWMRLYLLETVDLNV